MTRKLDVENLILELGIPVYESLVSNIVKRINKETECNKNKKGIVTIQSVPRLNGDFVFISAPFAIVKSEDVFFISIDEFIMHTESMPDMLLDLYNDLKKE